MFVARRWDFLAAESPCVLVRPTMPMPGELSTPCTSPCAGVVSLNHAQHSRSRIFVFGETQCVVCAHQLVQLCMVPSCLAAAL